MRKVFIFLVLGFCLTGCGSKKIMTMTCSKVQSYSDVSFDLSYDIEYKGKYVLNVSSTEKIISDDTLYLEDYRDQIEKIYSPYADLDYYDYNVSLDGNTLTSQSNIDYSKVDTEKMILIDDANSQFIQNGKVLVDTIKSYYEELGIVCNK